MSQAFPRLGFPALSIEITEEEILGDLFYPAAAPTGRRQGAPTDRAPQTADHIAGLLSPRPSVDYIDRVFRAAYTLCGNHADAEELVRETYARALKRTRFVRRDTHPAHLMRVLRRAWIDLQRTSATRVPATDAPEAIAWVLDRADDPRVLVRDVLLAYQGVLELPPRQREVIAAVDVLGLSHRDAARALRMRRRTLASNLHRARERIAATLPRRVE